MEGLESATSVEHGRTRAVVHVLVGILVRFVLGRDTKSSTGMAMPRTGGRFLVTVPGTRRQVSHTDFDVRSVEEIVEERGIPGYFAIVTGREEAEVFIVRHGQRIINLVWAMEPERLKELNRVARAELVKIPPLSCMLVRGDVVHFGAGWKDHEEVVESGVLARYHLYCVPENVELRNVVHLVEGYRPEIFEATE